MSFEPIVYQRDEVLQSRLDSLLAETLYKDRIGLCVINCSRGLTTPLIAGHREMEFTYPASLYKLYIAGAVLHQVNTAALRLSDIVLVSKVNAIDAKPEIPGDRRLLYSGDRVRVDHLLDMMITGSSNTAANCLIDYISRNKINQFIARHGWGGSVVTRKFLPREMEPPFYRHVPRTVSCARHFAEFLYLVEKGQIGRNSTELKEWLEEQLDRSKMKAGLPAGVIFSNKTGWYNDCDHPGSGYTGDAGIVEAGDLSYVISCLTEFPEPEGNHILAEIGAGVHQIMVDLHNNQK